MAISCRDVIKRALRLLGDLPDDEEPGAAEFNNAFDSFNAMIRAMHGLVIGPRLSPQQMSGSMQAENGALYQANLTAGGTLLSPKSPRSGFRFGVVDVGNNFATNVLVVSRGAQLFEGVPTDFEMRTNGEVLVWFFDGDTGNWIREVDIADADAVPPYPDRLNAYLSFLLAAYIAGEYGSDIRPDVVTMAVEGRIAFSRNYARRGRNQIDAPVGTNLPQAS